MSHYFHPTTTKKLESLLFKGVVPRSMTADKLEAFEQARQLVTSPGNELPVIVQISAKDLDPDLITHNPLGYKARLPVSSKDILYTP